MRERVGDDGNGRAKWDVTKRKKTKKKPTQAHNGQTSEQHMTSLIEKIEPERKGSRVQSRLSHNSISFHCHSSSQW